MKYSALLIGGLTALAAASAASLFAAAPAAGGMGGGGPGARGAMGAPGGGGPGSAPGGAPAGPGGGRAGGMGGRGGAAQGPGMKAPVPNTLPGLLGKPIKWKSTAPLVLPANDEAHTLHSVKDPTISFIDGKWEIYATAHMNSPQSRNTFNMIHVAFADWQDAPKAKLFYMDTNPNFTGYKCAPEMFYFTPQKKWYLIFQTQPPVYCTSDNPGDPNSWTRPQPFYAGNTQPVGGQWIDFHFIGDGEYMYMFYTGDNGNFCRARTKYEEFPKGFSTPVVVMSGNRNVVFEGSFTYKIKGVDKGYQYLTCIEGMGNGRFYSAYVAEKLDGDWYPVEGFTSADHPFAGRVNLSFEDGVTPWSGQVSHGEMIRDSNDEKMILDPNNLQFLYQGISEADDRASGDYGMKKYRLGLLRAVKPD
jgi:hypothetical protein